MGNDIKFDLETRVVPCDCCVLDIYSSGFRSELTAELYDPYHTTATRLPAQWMYK